MQALWPAAVGIALMSFTESIAAARAFAERDEPLPEPNRELFALGVANAAGGLLGAMPAGGGTSQTAINRLAGARSQAAELVTAAGALATLLLLAPTTRWMPQAALGAVSFGTRSAIQPRQFLAIRRVRTTGSAGPSSRSRSLCFTLQESSSRSSTAAVAGEPGVQPAALRGCTQARHGGLPANQLSILMTSWPKLLLKIEGRLFFANAHASRT